MIGSLRGSVVERIPPTTVLLEVQGVGYLVTVTPTALAELEPGSPAFLYTHHHIREDAQTLYGFSQRTERDTFEILIATHGIGPAMAIAIMSVHTPTSLIDIVATSDLASLTMVPGVGKKTAERLLVELKNRLTIDHIDPIGAVGDETSIVGSVREALTNLGYTSEEIREALRTVGSTSDAGVMLREALAVLGKQRA